MQVIIQDKNKYVLKFERGEEVIASLKEFCLEHKIGAANLTAIGAVSQLSLAFYNLKTQKYEDHNLEENFEITSVLGNIAWAGDDVVTHCHGTFADKNLKVVGGHINKMVVSGTCEMILEVMAGRIERKFNAETGLKLMSSL